MMNPVKRISLHLQDNVRYGNEAQLLGGYAAGWLVLSALTALVYLGFWLWCMLHLFRLEKVTPLIADHPTSAPSLVAS